MLVSVIIPCYNQGRYLDDALLSILNQTHNEWECIIVDDGSTDETKSVAMNWQQRDQRFRYVYKKNGGLSSARNYGLSFCKGAYIQFLDADDVIVPVKFEMQIQAIADMPGCTIALCDYMPSDEFDLTRPFDEGRYLKPFFSGDDFLQSLIYDWEVSLSIPCHCFLFSSFYFLEKNIRFDENLPNHEDWECWMRIFAMKPKVVQIKECMAVYRIRRAAMSYDAERMTKGFLSAIDKQMQLFKKDRYYHNLLRQKYYLVLSDYKCDNRSDYLNLRLKANYKLIRKKIHFVATLLKRKKSIQ